MNTVVTILALPCIMIMNDSEEMVWVNFLGLAYACLIVKLAPYFLPKWMIDYFRSIPEEEEDEM